MRFFRRLKGGYPQLLLASLVTTAIRRIAFTVIGVIMILWSWSVLTAQFGKFPNVDVIPTLIAVITLLLGIRNALSLFKDVSWGEVFLTVLFAIGMAYLTL